MHAINGLQAIIYNVGTMPSSSIPIILWGRVLEMMSVNEKRA